jgi:hypothetical protein
MTDQKQPLSIKIDTDYQNEIRLKSDERTAFLIRVIDGHTIEVSAGVVTRDGDGILYDDKLEIAPLYPGMIRISKPPYDL